MIYELRQYDKTLLKFEYVEKSLSRDNYSFSGYYYDEECSIAYRFYTPFNSDLTLYAGWTDLSSLIG